MKVGPNLNNASRKSAASFDRAATASGPCASLNLRRFRATRNANPTAVRQMAVVRAARRGHGLGQLVHALDLDAQIQSLRRIV